MGIDLVWFTFGNQKIVQNSGSLLPIQQPATRSATFELEQAARDSVNSSCQWLLKKINLIIVSSVLWTTLTLNTAYAQTWEILPSLQLQMEYNNNFDLTPDAPIEGFASEIIGSLDISRLTEIWQFRGFGEVDATQYSSDELDNTTNYFFGFASRYNPERSDWRLDGSYKRDTLFRTLDRIVTTQGVTPGQGEDVDVLLPQPEERQVTRELRTIKPTFGAQLSERSRIQLSYNLNDVAYSETQGTDLSDYRNHRLTLQNSYSLTERDALVTIAGANLYRASGVDRKYDSYGLLAGVDHRFSEQSRGGFRVGIQHTSFETPNENGDESGFLGSIFGSRKTEDTVFDATLERNLYPSGSGGMVQTDQILLRMNKELSPRLAFLLTARAFRTESVGTRNNQNDRNYLSFEPALNWALTESWSVQASYNYVRQKEQGDPEAADSNAVFVSLNYAPQSAVSQ